MTAIATAPRRIAVLDVGKTNVKAVLFDADTGLEHAPRTMPNVVRQDGPYPHFDTDRIEAFFLDALADLARDEGVDAISITTHGASGALLKGDGLALPVLDYEHTGPDALADDYDRMRPPFAETFSPRLPGGLNLGAQLFWQARTMPAAFAAAEAIVTYPQYWAFRLTGVAATEATSLGAHTDLWEPRAGRFSRLVSAMGWTDRMAPTRSAFDTLGPLRPALAARIGIDKAVPVACGIHDSNASLLPHVLLGGDPISVVSTGTWAIVFALGGALDRLDAARDTLANVDAFGRPIPSARFMGGREFDILTGGETGAVDAASLAAVLDKGIMALPTFAPGNGPFPHGRGRWSQPVDGLAPAERTVAASLYVAMMTATCLGLLAARGDTVIEGPFARSRLFYEALARLTGRPVRAARGSTGTSAGAARLLLPAGGPALPAAPGTGEAAEAPFALGEAFDAYAARWRAEADWG